MALEAVPADPPTKHPFEMVPFSLPPGPHFPNPFLPDPPGYDHSRPDLRFISCLVFFVETENSSNNLEDQEGKDREGKKTKDETLWHLSLPIGTDLSSSHFSSCLWNVFGLDRSIPLLLMENGLSTTVLDDTSRRFSLIPVRDEKMAGAYADKLLTYPAETIPYPRYSEIIWRAPWPPREPLPPWVVWSPPRAAFDARSIALDAFAALCRGRVPTVPTFCVEGCNHSLRDCLVFLYSQGYLQDPATLDPEPHRACLPRPLAEKVYDLGSSPLHLGIFSHSVPLTYLEKNNPLPLIACLPFSKIGLSDSHSFFFCPGWSRNPSFHTAFEISDALEWVHRGRLMQCWVTYLGLGVNHPSAFWSSKVESAPSLLSMVRKSHGVFSLKNKDLLRQKPDTSLSWDNLFRIRFHIVEDPEIWDFICSGDPSLPKNCRLILSHEKRWEISYRLRFKKSDDSDEVFRPVLEKERKGSCSIQ